MHYSQSKNTQASLQSEADPTLPLHVEKINQLFPQSQVHILKKQGGGNSVVYCVEVEGELWAVKSYPPFAPGRRDRLIAESSVYQFLNAAHVPHVPLLKTFCEKERLLVISWIDGVIPSEYVAEDIAQAIKFIETIVQLNNHDAAQALPQAAEACLSLQDITQQIKNRLHNLQGIDDIALQTFLREEFHPCFEAYQQKAFAGYQALYLDREEKLAPAQQSLIPADFGFHNTLRDVSGNLYFFDFDYFGWDDPVKLLADILWHPKMKLSASQEHQFIQGLSAIYKRDPLFLSRFEHTCPLFGLRWVLILLNEFIPAFWQNRQHADVHQNHIDAKKTQLQRARSLLQRVQQNRMPL